MSADYETHDLEWRGITIAIRYTPSWADFYEEIYGHPLAHLELEAVAPKRARLPLTGTGYRSHFTAPALIEAAGGPVAFVERALDEAAAQNEGWRQPSLFDD